MVKGGLIKLPVCWGYIPFPRDLGRAPGVSGGKKYARNEKTPSADSERSGPFDPRFSSGSGGGSGEAVPAARFRVRSRRGHHQHESEEQAPHGRRRQQAAVIHGLSHDARGAGVAKAAGGPEEDGR
eukprot:1196391-Prorocentrum_minimum.AAC.5